MSSKKKPGVRSHGYKHSISYYQHRFNMSEQSVFRWMKMGAPLDNDLALDKWALARRKLPNGFRIPKTAAFEQAQQNSAARQASAPEFAPGLRGEIQRLEHECVRLHKQYEEALESNLSSEAAINQKLWLAAQGALMKLRKEVPKAEQDDEAAVSIVEVERGLRRAFKELKTRLEMLPRRMVLIGKGLTPGALEKKWSAEVAEILGELRIAFSKFDSEQQDQQTNSDGGSGDSEAADAP